MGDINEFQMECNANRGYLSWSRVYTAEDKILYQLKTNSYTNKKGKRTPLKEYSVEQLQSILNSGKNIDKRIIEMLQLEISKRTKGA